MLERRPASSSTVNEARSAGLGLPEGNARFADEFRSKLARFDEQLFRCDDFIEKAPLERGFRVDHVPSHNQLASASVANSMRKALSAAKTRNQRQIDLGLAEPRLFARNNQVARHRQFQSSTEGKPVDGRDYRNRQVLYSLHYAMAQSAEFETVDAVISDIAAISAPATKARSPAPVTISTRIACHDERRAAPCQILDHLAVQGVKCLWPIDGKEPNFAFFKN